METEGHRMGPGNRGEPMENRGERWRQRDGLRGKDRERQRAGKEAWAGRQQRKTPGRERAGRKKRAEGTTPSQGFLVLLSLLTNFSDKGLVQTLLLPHYPPLSSLPLLTMPQFGCPLPCCSYKTSMGQTGTAAPSLIPLLLWHPRQWKLGLWDTEVPIPVLLLISCYTLGTSLTLFEFSYL